MVSSAVWLVFLPAWIAALFGTCWRQCCCCCCDPIVLCGALLDVVKVSSSKDFHTVTRC